jgi:hypothetical protein
MTAIVDLLFGLYLIGCAVVAFKAAPRIASRFEG